MFRRWAFLIAIIGIEKFGLLNFGTNSVVPSVTEGDDDDDLMNQNCTAQTDDLRIIISIKLPRDLIKSSLNTGALGMEFSWTYYKQMYLHFVLWLRNAQKIYHGRPDDYAAALRRHGILQYYGTVCPVCRRHCNGGTCYRRR